MDTGVTVTCDTVDEMVDWMDTTGKDYGDFLVAEQAILSML